MKKLLLFAIVLLLAASTALAQTSGPTVTNLLTVNVGAEATLTVQTGATTLTTTATDFSLPLTGTTTLTYYIRTTKATGGGTVTLKVTSDFSPGGGPSVGSPITPGDALTYVSTVSSPGTAVNGTASTSTATNVATFGAGVSSAKAGNSASVAWSLTDDPAYATGSYSATVTYTITVT